MQTNTLLTVQSAQEVEERNRMTSMEEQPVDDVSDLVSQLSQYVDKKWADAKRAKEPIEIKMLDSIYQRQGKYTEAKKKDIAASKQPNIFMNITDTKCRNATAWIKDIIIQPNSRIFSVDPTPIPELPPHITDRIEKEVVDNYVNLAVQEAATSGQIIPPEMLQQLIIEHTDEIKENVKKEVLRVSKELANNIADKIDDDWTEGNFYVALDSVIDDIVSLKAGIIKGPVFRNEKIKVSTLGNDGRLKQTVETRIVTQYERRSPFSIFPAPRSVDIDSGYLIDVVSLKPGNLYKLIGVDGFDQKAIREVLKLFNTGSLNNDWLGLSSEAKEGMGLDTSDDSLDQYPEENILGIEFWGEVPGNLLIEWGLSEGVDEDAEYDCCIWKIGDYVIKAMLNPDQLGKKPYYKTSFQTINDSFWGGDVCELIEDCQQICNACARSVLSNVALGALPQIGLNVDRLEPHASREVTPGKIWPFSEEVMASGVPPISFYQPKMVTDQLMNVYHNYSKIADEHSGVPAYAHGDSTVGGAGSTSSGLSMLIAQASRGIKAVVRNIDKDIIAKCATFHYSYLLDNYDIYGLFGDYKINAKGSSALVSKEQQANRKIEFLANTMNPVDIGLIGKENRRKELFSVAKSLGIELDETAITPKSQPMQGQVPPGQPQTLDPAGNPAQGVDNREFSPQRQRLTSGGN